MDVIPQKKPTDRKETINSYKRRLLYWHSESENLDDVTFKNLKGKRNVIQHVKSLCNPYKYVEFHLTS